MFLPGSIFSRVKHIGISITPFAVRAVVVESADHITNQAEVVSPESFIDGDRVIVDRLAPALTALKQKLGINDIYAACCFPEKLAFSREYSLPNLPNNEISEAISWQLASIFPLKPEELYTDWKLVERKNDQVRIIITAVSRQLLDGLVTSCQTAGIKPICFESSASALSRSLSPAPDEALIIEIDNFGSSITLVEHGVSSLTATTNFATAADSQSVLSDLVTTIEQLRSRVVKTLPTDSKVPMYVTGEKAVPELIQILSSKLGQEVLSLAPPKISIAYHSAYNESLSTVEAPESSTSINLLPQELESKYRQDTELSQVKTVFQYGLGFSIISFIISLGLYFLSLFTVTTSTKNLASIATPPKPPADINLNLLLQKSQKITQSLVYEYLPKAHLEAITASQSAYPLKQLSYDASKKTIQLGYSQMDRSQLFSLKSDLDQTRLFGQISIPLSALSSTTAESNTFVLTLKEPVK